MARRAKPTEYHEEENIKPLGNNRIKSILLVQIAMDTVVV